MKINASLQGTNYKLKDLLQGCHPCSISKAACNAFRRDLEEYLMVKYRLFFVLLKHILTILSCFLLLPDTLR